MDQLVGTLSRARDLLDLLPMAPELAQRTAMAMRLMDQAVSEIDEEICGASASRR